MEISSQRLRVAAWVCIVQAALNVPLTVVYWMVGRAGGALEMILIPLIATLGICLFLFIWLTFRAITRSLDDRLQKWLNALLVIGLIGYFFSAASGLVPAESEGTMVIAIFAIFGALINGIVDIGIATRLIALGRDVPSLKILGFALIAEAVCYFSIVLMVFALIPQIIASLALAFVFFHFAALNDSSEENDASFTQPSPTC